MTDCEICGVPEKYNIHLRSCPNFEPPTDEEIKAAIARLRVGLKKMREEIEAAND